jgi:hypothetical protein
MRFVAQYLSMCQLCLMKYMSQTAGCEKLDLLSTRCSLTPCGLPRIIPSSHRKILRRRDTNAKLVARIYMTIFGLHRLYKVTKTHPSLKSVTGRLTVEVKSNKAWQDFRMALRTTLPLLLYKSFSLTREIPLGFKWVPSWSSGPAPVPFRDRTNVLSLGIDSFSYHSMFKSKKYKTEKNEVVKVLATGRSVDPGVSRIISCLGCFWYPERIHIAGTRLLPVNPDAFETFCEQAIPKDHDFLRNQWNLGDGKLGRKYEGGGKVRLFSITDSVRQSCLRPLHEYFMSILKAIPQDGTFNQLRPLKLLIKRVKNKGPIYCYDLKSATDRFPVVIQRKLLEWFLGASGANAWLDLMCNQNFFIPWKKKTPDLLVAFKIGQPLGVYSSWPVFALTHHLLIQYCADATISGKWFDQYALLGDDIVIADKQVAIRYKYLINSLGVEISEKKTLTSENCCIEFAKRFIVEGDDISPISYKNVFSLIPQTVGELVKRVSEFRPVRRSEPYRWLGAGYRILAKSLYPKNTGKRWKRYHLLLTNPKGPFPLPHLWWHSFYAPRPATDQDIAVVRESLLSKTKLDFNPSLGVYSKYTGEDILEKVVYGNWLKAYYQLITDFLLELIKTDDLTPWYSRPNMSNKPSRTLRVELVRYGIMFRCWERVHRLCHRPALLRIAPNCVDIPTKT